MTKSSKDCTIVWYCKNGKKLMGTRIVKQPSGDFGVFSENVDNFVHLNVPRSRIAEVAADHVGPDVEERIDTALRDIGRNGKTIDPNQGLGRWYEALEIVKAVGGDEAHQKLLQDAASGAEMVR